MALSQETLLPFLCFCGTGDFPVKNSETGLRSVPHFRQNFPSSGFFIPHLGQNIFLLPKFLKLKNQSTRLKAFNKFPKLITKVKVASIITAKQLLISKTVNIFHKTKRKEITETIEKTTFI
jgi:hypothetical protein